MENHVVLSESFKDTCRNTLSSLNFPENLLSEILKSVDSSIIVAFTDAALLLNSYLNKADNWQIHRLYILMSSSRIYNRHGALKTIGLSNVDSKPLNFECKYFAKYITYFKSLNEEIDFRFLPADFTEYNFVCTDSIRILFINCFYDAKLTKNILEMIKNLSNTNNFIINKLFLGLSSINTMKRINALSDFFDTPSYYCLARNTRIQKIILKIISEVYISDNFD